MTYYKAFHNTIVDDTGKQIAVIVPTNCTKKMARVMAGVAAQHANVLERNKQREAANRAQAKRMGGFPVDYQPAPFLEGKDAEGVPVRFGRLDGNYVLCWPAYGEDGEAGSLRTGERVAAQIFSQAAVDAYIKANPVSI